ncbi:MAG: hypothetical protein FJ290_31385 [Planctomycetes bacterium]|nr:hypothetical protein [Planctomycetota bacterium]
MKKPAPPADLWAKLDAVEAQTFGAETPGVPDNAFTVDDYCEHRGGMNRETARGRLSRLVGKGALKAGKRLGHVSDGRRVLKTVYWVP